ncbi:MAG TPA: hypothetical protein VMK83_03365 [Gaiellaceae bacterium]|nr:hypothetical protein [Gaiellaceae bacterium]
MEVLLLLAVLVCPVVMGGMMVWMVRQMRAGARGEPPHEDGPR